MNRKTNKHAGRAKRFITVTVLLSMILCCAGCKKKTPREVLEDAYNKTFVTDTSSETILGLSEINKHLSDNKASSTGLSLTIQELSGKGLEEVSGILSGLGFRFDSASDLLNRKSSGTVDITYGGTTYFTLGGQLQGSKLHLTSPQLLDGNVSVDLSTIEEDLASDSMIGQLFSMYQISLPEDFSTDLFESYTSPSSLADMTALISAWNDFNSAIVVEKLDKKTVSFPSDVSFKNAYSVTVPKHAYVALINELLKYSFSTDSIAESLAEYLDAEAPATTETELLNAKLAVQELANVVGDIVVNVAVTKNGYISYAESEIAYGGEAIRLTASFTGEDAPVNDTDVSLVVSASGKSFEMVYTQDFDPEDNELEFGFSAKEDGVSQMNLAGRGRYTDIEKGKKYTFDYDFIEFKMMDELSFSVSGDFYVDTTKCEITAPSSPEYNLLRMTEDEFTALGTEILDNLKNDPVLSTLFDTAISGM